MYIFFSISFNPPTDVTIARPNSVLGWGKGVESEWVEMISKFPNWSAKEVVIRSKLMFYVSYGVDGRDVVGCFLC